MKATLDNLDCDELAEMVKGSPAGDQVLASNPSAEQLKATMLSALTQLDSASASAVLQAFSTAVAEHVMARNFLLSPGRMWEKKEPDVFSKDVRVRMCSGLKVPADGLGQVPNSQEEVKVAEEIKLKLSGKQKGSCSVRFVFIFLS